MSYRLRKINQKNVRRIEKRRIFAADMKRMYLQYEIQCACPSVLAERFVVNTPPDCNSLLINSLRENMDSAADRRSGAFGGFRRLRSFKVSKVSKVSRVSRVSRFQGL